MQQTGKYKLNLIEKSDTFSPDPLNENMQKVEAAITAETAAEAQARAAANAALDKRLRVIEVHKIAVGTYPPEDGIEINLGFRPKFVVLHALGNVTAGTVILDGVDCASLNEVAVITDTGFRMGRFERYAAVNLTIFDHSYIAFA